MFTVDSNTDNKVSEVVFGDDPHNCPEIDYLEVAFDNLIVLYSIKKVQFEENDPYSKEQWSDLPSDYYESDSDSALEELFMSKKQLRKLKKAEKKLNKKKDKRFILMIFILQ